MKRLFVGISLPEEVKEKIAIFSKAVKETEGEFRFVSAENLHITLSFVGDVEEGNIIFIVEKLISALAHHETIKIAVVGSGVFPAVERINVVWVGLKNGALTDLIKKINATLSINAGHEEETPHVTIARVKSGKNKQKIREVVEQFKQFDFGTFVADKITLYESELTSAGPVYHIVKEVELVQ
ncbi:RNA 2',3'-cyclic phosphodiesterase [Candidatus Woesearchaeota archaeon]|nr:RNA 2',3'-cyclic phosphodiesterase [Candidatus Woesearchaeota archaeon]